MKIQTIGTGSMWNEYNSACYLIDENIMIDFPNGACKYLYRQKIKPSKIEYLLLTHFHGDHYFDIPFLILNKSKNNNYNLKIYSSKEGKKKINKLGNLAFPNSYKDAINSLKINFITSDNFKIENYEVSKILVDHGRMKPAYGYTFKINDKVVSFTGDTTYCENVDKMASISNYMFCDCMFIYSTDKHSGIDNITYLADKYKNCTFVVSHLENETREELKKRNIKNIIVPKDGEEYTI